MNELLSKLETLNYCFVFLNSYPKRRLWDKTFGRAEYIKYHLESYYTNMGGVLDRCLLLVNFLYDLGIQEKYVKFRLITSNKHLQNKPVKKVLDRFDKALSNIKEVRNLIIHRGRFSEDELVVLEQHELINRKGVKLTKKERKLIEFYLKMEFGAYASKKKREVIKNNEVVYKLCDMFFSSLEKKYMWRINAL